MMKIKTIALTTVIALSITNDVAQAMYRAALVGAAVTRARQLQSNSDSYSSQRKLDEKEEIVRRLEEMEDYIEDLEQQVHSLEVENQCYKDASISVTADGKLKWQFPPPCITLTGIQVPQGVAGADGQDETDGDW